MKQRMYYVAVDASHGAPYVIKVYEHGTREQLEKIEAPNGLKPVLLGLQVDDIQGIPGDLLEFLEGRGERFVGTIPAIIPETHFYIVSESGEELGKSPAQASEDWQSRLGPANA